jgi:hypothetical protein
MISSEIKWICTDPSKNQHGRHIENDHFQFYTGNSTPVDIYLKKYEAEQIEEIINSYGYTLGENKEDNINIKSIYGRTSAWIIAECLYESLFENFEPI